VTVATSNKWTKKFLVDLAERVGATFVGALIAVFSADQSGTIIGSPEQWWILVGLPTLLSLLKGVAANFAAPETGASLIPEAPPGPKVNPDEGGYAVLGALGLGLIVLSVLLLVLALLKVVATGWVVLVVLFVVGLVLVWVDRDGPRRL
jgi:hypothetical protein